MWALPGPARFVAGLCDALYKERVAAVRAPVGRDELAVALESRLNDDGQVHVISLRPETGVAILDAIADAAGVRRGSAASLVTAPDLADRAIIVVLELHQRPEPPLLEFARLASRSARLGEPLVVILGGGTLPGISGKAAMEIRGVVGPLDSAASLALQPTALGAFEHRLVASTAIETAGWDIETLGRLASLPIASAVRPDLFTQAWADERKGAWTGVKADWAAGCTDQWGGVPCEHPQWLAANRPDLLTKRVWRGQVAVLLPWIETRRLEIIARYGGRLRPDPVRCGPDIESLDWGPLGYQLNREASWLVNLVETHRTARNELAHGRPLTWTHITQCLTGARRWAAS